MLQLTGHDFRVLTTLKGRHYHCQFKCQPGDLLEYMNEEEYNKLFGSK